MCWSVLFSTTSAAFCALTLYFFIKGNNDIGSCILVLTIVNVLFAIKICLNMRAEEQIRHIQRTIANPMQEQPAIIIQIPPKV